MYAEKKRLEYDGYRIMITVGLVVDAVLWLNVFYQFAKAF